MAIRGLLWILVSVMVASAILSAIIAWHARRELAGVKKLALTQATYHSTRLSDLLSTLRHGSVRYEVEFTDWGSGHLDMRFRWTIWDADRMLVLLADPNAAPEGLMIPFMLGNAKTRAMAEAQALGWVHLQSANKVVIMAPPLKRVSMPDEVMRIDLSSKKEYGLFSPSQVLINGEPSAATVQVQVDLNKERTITLDGVKVRARLFLDGVVMADTTVPPLTKRTLPAINETAP